jgi:hypothetical protein
MYKKAGFDDIDLADTPKEIRTKDDAKKKQEKKTEEQNGWEFTRTRKEEKGEEYTK